MVKKTLDIPVKGVALKGDLTFPEHPKGLIIFSHGNSSSRLSPRDLYVAEQMQQNGFATFLLDLLTPEENAHTEHGFDIHLLTLRLTLATLRLTKQADYPDWNIAYFGTSTGSASALKAAALLGPNLIKGIVSLGGRPDLAGTDLKYVKSPTLLMVGGLDTEVMKLNENAIDKLSCTKKLKIIQGASHLFEETGKLEYVNEYSKYWFEKHLYWQTTELDKELISS